MQDEVDAIETEMLSGVDQITSAINLSVPFKFGDWLSWTQHYIMP